MPTDFAKLRAVFQEAVERPPDERAALLDLVCQDDTALRQGVEQLLEAHARGNSILDNGPLAANAAIAERPGMQIGPYKILEQLGEGGFGVVFMAQQLEPLRRKVALKVVKPGMDTRQVITRFEAEQQALALMDHPNIAQVFEAGTTDSGRPYFVMELVRGMPITDFCDQRQATIKERLTLIIAVCQAVQHAHQKGIIHRDLKPSNVLVTLHDGTPVVKVIDFGIAKAVGQQLTEKTLFTNFTQMMGTPLYMSPEQAALSGLDVDTRSDVYSLGVLLYELLTGTTPFEKERLRKADFDEMRRIIREEEPPKPSTRVSTLGKLGDTVSACRQRATRQLSLLLGGDLDWIVMKCISKDRTRRYESPGALAADLERHLHGQPVEARPPTTAYRLNKFARRNRVAIATTSLVAVSLVVGTAASLWQARRAIDAERMTRGALTAEKQARKDADIARQRAEANFEDARQAVNRYYTLVSQSNLLDEPGLQPLRKELLEAALVYYEKFLAERRRDPRLKVELAATYIRAGKVCQLVDRNDEAVAHLKRGLDLVEEMLRDPASASAMKAHLAGVHNAGRTLHVGTRPPSDLSDALRTLERGAALWEELAGRYPETIGFRSDLAGYYLLIGDLQRTVGQKREGRKAYERAKEIVAELVREDPHLADYRTDLATCHEVLSLLNAAEGNRLEAESNLGQAVSLREALADEFPERPEYRVELASAYRMLAIQSHAGDPPAKIASLQKAGELLEKLASEYRSIPAYDEQLGRVQLSLAEQFAAAGRPAEAEQSAEQAKAVFEKLASHYPHSSHYQERLVLYYRDVLPLVERAGRSAEVKHAWERIIALQKALAADFSRVPRYHEELARFLLACPIVELRDLPLAIRSAELAVKMQPDNGDNWKTLGAAHFRDGNWSAAKESLEKSLETPPGAKALNRFFLAMTLWHLGEKELARNRYEEGAAWMGKNRPKNKEILRIRTEAEELLEITAH